MEEEDKERYQIMQSMVVVAAPTTGLHFSKHTQILEKKGINIAELTLHVGLGTFRKLEAEDLSKHKMDSEELIIDKIAVEKVNKTKQKRKNMCSWNNSHERP